MPDISMCTRFVCTRRDTCYRYLAVPSKHRQTYMSPQETGSECGYWTHTLLGDNLRSVTAVDGAWARQREKEKNHEEQAAD